MAYYDRCCQKEDVTIIMGNQAIPEDEFGGFRYEVNLLDDSKLISIYMSANYYEAIQDKLENESIDIILLYRNLQSAGEDRIRKETLTKFNKKYCFGPRPREKTPYEIEGIFREINYEFTVSRTPSPKTE